MPDPTMTLDKSPALPGPLSAGEAQAPLGTPLRSLSLLLWVVGAKPTLRWPWVQSCSSSPHLPSLPRLSWGQGSRVHARVVPLALGPGWPQLPPQGKKPQSQETFGFCVCVGHPPGPPGCILVLGQQ